MKFSPQQEALLNSGNYAQKQIYSKSLLMSFSHRKRFEFSKELIKRLAPQTLLDYGCGDGTFLIYNMDNVKFKVGYDLSEQAISENRERLKERQDFSFLTRSELETSEKKYDVVTCMEVLEHCTPETIETLKKEFLSLLAPEGKLIISVPVETGGAVFVKQTVRWLLGLMKFGSYEYTEHYKLSDLFKMVFPSEEQDVPRNYYQVKGYTTCGHYAFNWKHLKKVLSSDFDITEQHFTPVPLLGPLLNGQVWFVCHRKATP